MNARPEQLRPTAPIRSVVFAGGGNRCLWQAGFWSVAGGELCGPSGRPQLAAGVSAGAAIACLIFAGQAEAALARFERATAANPRNFYPRNVFRGRPMFPHEAMYRAVVLDGIDDATLARLHAGPDIRVLLARPPRLLGPRAAVWVGFSAYNLERQLLQPVHPALGRRIGFTSETVSIRTCHTPAELADLVLHSSCTPPFTPVYRRDGRPVLEGGLVDNVPVVALDDAPDAHPMLVLLTRPYPPDRLPRLPGRTYVQPSQPIAISKFDYANPRGLRAAWDLGCRDAERFLAAPAAA